MAENYLEKLRGVRRRFWLVFCFWLALLGASTWFAWGHFGEVMGQNADPLLKGPPEFIVLSLVVAFAVYLRQVSVGATQLRDSIRKGEVRLYPLGQQFTKDRMNALDSTCENLTVAAPFLIIPTIIVALRILIDSILRFPSSAFKGYNWLLTIVDFVITLWLCAVFLALSILHARARRRDDRIRAQARNYEERTHPHLGETKQVVRKTTEPLAQPADQHREARGQTHSRIGKAAGIVALALLLFAAALQPNREDGPNALER